MKILLIPICTLIIGPWLQAADTFGAPVTSPLGDFTVSQFYNQDSGWTAQLTFKKSTLNPLILEPAQMQWAANYSISPDGAWILRIQKTGSGDNIGILYHVERDGRIAKIDGFNDDLWTTSDAYSQLPKSELYHTAITDIEWKGSDSVTIHLQGSNAHKSEDGIKCIVDYNLKNNVFSFRQK